ncbi:hypothetical protein HYPSUDRAFT_55015 [Hypholoma sublateritium FD-334 SS-4]|uniref:Fe2OG dioxygenase domain-containing protein n=1 Tax=Hypholoma sublateritium (strain FD-334 SS-4) TaxID=945553 RepID=A0A0D2MEP7_HYPSF|nr:hypothetical protein HYPSUDRAFT_55015 [Hypholoma sublateritium FD-334 SS-4]
MPIKTPAENSRIATLQTIDFKRLMDRDVTEQKKLLELSIKDGFFYLDLQGPTTGKILEDKATVVRVMEWYFALPEGEKMKDDRGSHTHGYKPPGTFTGYKKGSRDCYETLKHSEVLPGAVKARSELFESFIGLSHFVTKNAPRESLRRIVLARPSSIRRASSGRQTFQHDACPSPLPQQGLDDGMGYNKHTDIGSITLLFTEQWGLQLQRPGSSEWEFVAPRDGHAIINIGDSLRFLSGKLFSSCLHRVIPVAADEDRYSIAYFLRPENAAHLEDTEGRRIKAGEWHDQKYAMFGESHEKQAMSNMLTGGMEKVPVTA